MTNLYNIITSIKKKIVSPKVYSIHFENTRTHENYLTLIVAYDLEEAINCSNVKIHQNSPLIDLSDLTVKMFVTLPLRQIIEEATEAHLLPNNTTIDKNELMKKIISSHDINTFHENLSIFSSEETAYLNNELQKK